MRRSATLGLVVLAALAPLVPSQAAAQTYEVMFGEPHGVSLEEVERGSSYEGRAVRTQGTIGPLGVERGLYELHENGARVLLIPTREYSDPSDLLRLLGRRVEVVGVVRRLPDGAVSDVGADPMLPPLPDRQGHLDWPFYSITFWRIVDATDPGRAKKIEYKDLTLEALVTASGRHDGLMVRVVGKFRGGNLYGDLPTASRRASSDWVIKDELFAVWVTGKKPKGDGWQLDASLKRDTGKWIEVIGRPETVRGVTYVRVARIALTGPPSATAQAQAPPPPPERPKVPPVVVFALPLDGERGLAPDSHFVVQFSKDMDETTFQGRVQLRYAGPVRPGDRTFEGLKVVYDRGRRALTVDPGDLLRPGRLLELVLLPGIADLEGLSLVSRPGREAEGVADIFRFEIGT
jgi:hypothetical protein